MNTHLSRYIRAELIRRGWNLARLAAELHVTRGALSRIASGQSRSLRIEGAICRVIGQPWAALFKPLKRKSSVRVGDSIV